MADGDTPVGGENLLAGTTVVYDSLAASPSAALLGAMGFTLMVSAALLVVASPLLHLFSTLFLFAALVFATSVDGFGAAMAAAGLSSLASVPFERSGLLELSGLVWANGWTLGAQGPGATG